MGILAGYAVYCVAVYLYCCWRLLKKSPTGLPKYENPPEPPFRRHEWTEGITPSCGGYVVNTSPSCNTKEPRPKQ